MDSKKFDQIAKSLSAIDTRRQATSKIAMFALGGSLTLTNPNPSRAAEKKCQTSKMNACMKQVREEIAQFLNANCNPTVKAIELITGAGVSGVAPRGALGLLLEMIKVEIEIGFCANQASVIARDRVKVCKQKYGCPSLGQVCCKDTCISGKKC